jgi:metallo-beta-lactamase family protein
VGYQAEGSLGRILLNGEKRVTLFDEEIFVRAKIRSLHGTSGHADREGLLNWLQGFKNKPRLTFVNHGENQSCEDFKNLLNERGYVADAPYSGTEYDLITGRITIYTEGKPIDRESVYKGNSRADTIYRSMLDEAENLLALVKSRKGRTNKENAKFTSQLRELYNKWKGE